MMGRSGQSGRRNSNGVRAGKQIGFVIGEKAEQRSQQRRIFEARSQLARIQPGQGKQSLGAVLILQHPAERLQGDDFAVRPEIGICFHCRFRLMVRRQV